MSSIILNDSSSEIFTGSQGGLIQIFDMNSSKNKFNFQGHGTVCSVLNLVNSNSSPHMLASGAIDGKIKIWDIRSKANIGNGIKGHMAEIKTLCLSPDCNYLLSGADDKVCKVWDLRMSKTITEITEKSQGVITASEFSPTRKAFVFGSTDKTIKYWDMDENDLVNKNGLIFLQIFQTNFDRLPSLKLKFDANNNILFSATDGALKLFEIVDERLTLVDMIETGWTKFQDMFVSENDYVSGKLK